MTDISLPRFPPPLADRDLLLPREFAARMRQNVLAAFSERAFTEEVLSRRLFGREQITLNRPAAIRHVLVDNAENYRRTAATVRLLYPIVGRGLFLAEGEDWREQRRSVAPSFAPRTVLDILLPAWLPAPQDFARWQFRRHWLGLIDEIVAARQARAKPGMPRDLLDLMASDPETGRPVPRRRLADQVATMIAAGHATTAVALFWSFYLLAAAPAVQQRIAAEAAPLDLSPEGAADALQQLSYTRAVVQESLRLYPPAYGIFRLARQADEADGVPIPKGAVVMIAPWLLHRHRRLWADPDVFDPARFLPGAPPPDRFSYLPFGTGPRVCIGAQFALTEATLVLARLVRQFEIARADDWPVIPVAAITVRPDHPPPFHLRPR